MTHLKPSPSNPTHFALMLFSSLALLLGALSAHADDVPSVIAECHSASPRINSLAISSLKVIKSCNSQNFSTYSVEIIRTLFGHSTKTFNYDLSKEFERSKPVDGVAYTTSQYGWSAVPGNDVQRGGKILIDGGNLATVYDIGMNSFSILHCTTPSDDGACP